MLNQTENIYTIFKEFAIESNDPFLIERAEEYFKYKKMSWINPKKIYYFLWEFSTLEEYVLHSPRFKSYILCH